MTTFSMLPNPIPYLESESLSLLRRFRILVSFFLITFLSLSNFLLNCAKDCFKRIGFLSAFLSGAEIGFFCSVFLETMSIASIVRRVRASMFLAQVTVFLGTHLLRDSGFMVSTRSLCTFCLAVRSFLVARSV